MAKIDKTLFKLRSCNQCGKKDTYITNSGTPLWYVDKSSKDGWLCHKCYTKAKSRSKGGFIDTQKSLMDIRICNVGIDSDKGIYIMSQAVVANVLKIEDLNIKNDNFMWYIDMFHEEYKKIDVKCSSLWQRNGIEMWTYATHKKIDCDTYFLIGFGNNHHNVEDLRIIPNEGCISNLTTITISKNSLKTSKYDQFKEDHIQYDNAYHRLRSFLGDKNYFGIDDIKNWLIK